MPIIPLTVRECELLFTAVTYTLSNLADVEHAFICENDVLDVAGKPVSFPDPLELRRLQRVVEQFLDKERGIKDEDHNRLPA